MCDVQTSTVNNYNIVKSFVGFSEEEVIEISGNIMASTKSSNQLGPRPPLVVVGLALGGISKPSFHLNE